MFKKSIVLVLCAVLFCSSALAQMGLPSPGNQTIYNVRNFGAVGDGKNLDSPAIDRAIEACAKSGGGTVYLPAGAYLSGSIHLKSNIHLFLDAGSTILGAPQEMNAYDPPEPFEGKAYQDGGHTYFHNSLIWGENLTNVSITGPGMINGGGLTSKDKDIGQGSIGLGDKAVALKRCRHVLLRDFTVFHGGHFAIIVTGCDDIAIDNVTIDTNRDGINIDCITLGRRNRGPDSVSVGKVRNIIISNVIATGIDSMSGVHITGLPGYKAEDVRLQNVWLSYKGGGTKEHAERVPPELDKGYPEPGRIGVTPAYGVFARHVKGLELSDIRLDFEKEDLRPAIVCVDVDGLEIDNFKARVASGVRAARFEDVKGLVIRNSPVLE